VLTNHFCPFGTLSIDEELIIRNRDGHVEVDAGSDRVVDASLKIGASTPQECRLYRLYLVTVPEVCLAEHNLQKNSGVGEHDPGVQQQNQQQISTYHF